MPNFFAPQQIRQQVKFSAPTIPTALHDSSKGKSSSKGKEKPIRGDPGATSGDDAKFLGESLLQELKSPWELILTEPVPEMVEFRPADWAEKYFSA